MEYDGSSTESEYYEYSEDERAPKQRTVSDSAASSAHVRGGASVGESELASGDVRAPAAPAHWNNILTPDLAAAVARVTAHMSQLARAAPLAIPLDPPVEMLPKSSEYVSPFAALAQPKPVKTEKVEPKLEASAAEAVVVQEAQRERVVNGRVVIDLSLDSDDDDDEDNEATTETKAPEPVQPPDPQPLLQPERQERDRQHTRWPRHEVVSRTSQRPPSATTLAQAPVVHEVVSRTPQQSSSGRTPVPAPASSVPQLTLACTRCRRLVPAHSRDPANASYDCKCCGRKYIQGELAVRGANRQCLFCYHRPQSRPRVPPAAHPKPTTPRADDVRMYEASISPPVESISSPRLQHSISSQPKTLPSRGRPATYPSRVVGTTVSRPSITCVTCHQPLTALKPVPAHQDPSPWFCTCCQRLLCDRMYPPEKGSGSAVIGVPRCVACAIAACDLDRRLDARRPNFELLKQLRRLSRKLETLLSEYLNSKTIDHLEARKRLSENAIKKEIDERMNLWRRRLARVRFIQRKNLRRSDISHSEHREMFADQVALDAEEADVRTRLVAFLAVYLHDQGVALPQDVRGIVPDDKPPSDAHRAREKRKESQAIAQLSEVNTQQRVHSSHASQKRPSAVSPRNRPNATPVSSRPDRSRHHHFEHRHHNSQSVSHKVTSASAVSPRRRSHAMPVSTTSSSHHVERQHHNIGHTSTYRSDAPPVSTRADKPRHHHTEHRHRISDQTQRQDLDMSTGACSSSASSVHRSDQSHHRHPKTTDTYRAPASKRTRYLSYSK